jgi:hypothetical protein
VHASIYHMNKGVNFPNLHTVLRYGKSVSYASICVNINEHN